MTDPTEAIRRALEAGPTDGPWIAAGPSYGAYLPVHCDEVLIDRGGDEDDGYTVCRAPLGLDKASTVDMNFIAACNPAAIRALLDRLDSAERALVDCKVKIARAALALKATAGGVA